MLTQTFGLDVNQSPEALAAALSLLDRAEQHLLHSCQEASPTASATSTSAPGTGGCGTLIPGEGSDIFSQAGWT